MTTKIISIRQPFAWAIYAANIPTARRKEVENRNWNTKYRGRILIHAGKQMVRDFETLRFIESTAGVMIPTTLPTGGIVAQAYLTGVVTHSKSPWFFGQYGFVLENAKELPFLELSGRLSLYEAPAIVLDHFKLD